MSDESRLRILSLIFHHGEICISDLERVLDFTQAKTSRHVIYLTTEIFASYIAPTNRNRRPGGFPPVDDAAASGMAWTDPCKFLLLNIIENDSQFHTTNTANFPGFVAPNAIAYDDLGLIGFYGTVTMTKKLIRIGQ